MLSDLGDDAALGNLQRHGVTEDALDHVGRHVVIAVDPARAVDHDLAETEQVAKERLGHVRLGAVEEGFPQVEKLLEDDRANCRRFRIAKLDLLDLS